LCKYEDFSLKYCVINFYVALQFQDGESNIFRQNEVFVSITNNITNTQLRVHCKDEDTNLGSYKLKYGETYTFSFRPWILVLVELYFCRFSWLNESHYFEIYNEFENETCNERCVWKINKSGPGVVMLNAFHGMKMLHFICNLFNILFNENYVEEMMNYYNKKKIIFPINH